ncbi:hypothetical protein [Rhizobium leguminosarum]|uniref:hypothetical protein n=1 Tax=Rhizobium leguminosarum TaxID=384 RepID=UPI0014425A04|nr:hypothetical protein [Rhizobium leguminosarum]NKK82652.1 hypothetical protein [Rhizobium leguminosarum bv. viciae]
MAIDDNQGIQSNLSRRSRELVGMLAGIGMIGAATYGAWWFMVAGIKPQAEGALLIYGFATAIVGVLLLMGTRILISTVSMRKDVIPSLDRDLLEPLIRAGDEKAIDQYVRLSSLSGTTGTATKLGLTGLPLLTVALTLVFSALELYKPGSGFMDLTKLTLGAFIGSFVQRVATTQQVAAGGPRIRPDV